MTEISIIFYTYRLGLDVTFYSLQNQLFRDFELVLVDELYDERKDLVAALKAKFPIQHLEPISRENWAITKNWNWALAHAKGELIVTLDDYTYCPPRWLALHRAFSQIFHRRKAIVLGPTHDVDFPETKWGKGWIMNGKKPLVPLQEALWSVFKPTTLEVKDLKIKRFDGGKPITPRLMGLVPTRYAYGNICVPLEVFLELNGYDEAYTLQHGFHDVDFAFRMNALGWQVFYDPDNPVYHFWHEEAFRMEHGGFKRNERYFNIRKAQIASDPSKAYAPNPYSLKDLRRNIHENIASQP